MTSPWNRNITDYVFTILEVMSWRHKKPWVHENLKYFKNLSCFSVKKYLFFNSLFNVFSYMKGKSQLKQRQRQCCVFATLPVWTADKKKVRKHQTSGGVYLPGTWIERQQWWMKVFNDLVFPHFYICSVNKGSESLLVVACVCYSDNKVKFIIIDNYLGNYSYYIS